MGPISIGYNEIHGFKKTKLAKFYGYSQLKLLLEKDMAEEHDAATEEVEI